MNKKDPVDAKEYDLITLKHKPEWKLGIGDQGASEKHFFEIRLEYPWKL